VNSHVSVAAKNDGTQIAGLEFVNADKLYQCVANLIDAEAGIDAVNLRGVDESTDVLAKPEDGRTAGSLIAADSFENRTPVTDDVG
jgi:hypothetical protein